MIKIIAEKTNRINENETLRYLGIAGHSVDDSYDALFSECGEQVLAVQAPVACYDVFDVRREGEVLDLGFAPVKSKDLARNLDGCARIILFASTVGVGIDRLIAKYNRLSPAKAAVIQAMGSAMAEDWCDVLCAKFGAIFGETCPRYSCGYGDLPLELQRDIFRVLDVTKNIGITLSDNCFMTPTKSVTAIVGIKGAAK